MSTTNRYYWVPENMLYATAGDCLDARPDDGAAALVVSDVAYRELEQKLAVAVEAGLRLANRVQDYAEGGCIEAYSYEENLKGEKDICLADVVDLAQEALALIKPERGDL
jgi:hypothetical protein